MAIQTKRIYQPPAAEDGTRILVDRLWPRGVSKQKAALDGWFKEVAPSTELRDWFCHKPELFPAFTRRYRQELDTDAEKHKLALQLAAMARSGPLTLLYGARDEQINQAVVLRQYLEELEKV